MARSAVAVLAAILISAGPASPQDPPDLKARAQELRQRVAEIRGLAFKSDVKVALFDAAGLRDYLKREQNELLPPDRAKRLARVYAHLGLLPADFDLGAALVEAAAPAVRGAYDVRTRELRLVPSPDGGASDLEKSIKEQLGIQVRLSEIAVSHELAHALQDQHFDLTTLPTESEDNEDMALAVKALVEGDATVVGLRHGLTEAFETLARIFLEDYKSANLPGSRGTLPALIRRQITFPYGFGAEFVLHLHARGEWKAVTAAFDDLPASTEQILHPRKYAPDRDRPQSVIFKDPAGLAGPGWTRLHEGVLGEFGILTILEEFKPGTHRDRLRAAEGWDGDRLLVWEGPGGALASAWLTTWDSEEDAAEFYESYAALLQAKHRGAAKEAVPQKLILRSGAGRQSLIERRGADVLVLDGVDDATAARVNAVWTAAVKAEISSTPKRAPMKRNP